MYVYRFKDKNDIIIYVGKTKVSLRKRFYSHNHLPDECYQKVWCIEYIECPTESDMSIKEIYYINQERSKGNAEYNTLDVSEIPQDFVSQDNWRRYLGSLPDTFLNSINYVEHYEDDREEIITASDGRRMKLVYNSKVGKEKFVYPFSAAELSKLFSYYKQQIIESSSVYAEYSYFRNILFLAIGISTPYKSKEIIDLKYCDCFDEDNEVRGYRIVRDNVVYEFAYPMPVIKLLYAFQDAYGANYNENKDKYIFVGKQGEKVSYTSVNKAILSGCSQCEIILRHSTESLRKTFFRTILDESPNICEAIEYIEFYSGVYSHFPGRVLKYIDAIPHNHTLNPINYIKINILLTSWIMIGTLILDLRKNGYGKIKKQLSEG